MVRKTLMIFLVGILAVVLGSCGGNRDSSDADYAAKYKAAVSPIQHIERVETDYKSVSAMGRSGRVTIYADTSDRDVMMAVLEEAFPAVVNAAKGDPQVSLPIKVVSADKATVVDPTDLGYSGTDALSGYREFLGE